MYYDISYLLFGDRMNLFEVILNILCIRFAFVY